MYKDNFEYNKILNGVVEKFCIRPLSKEDIEQIALARFAQEEENGNGATKEYLEEYKKGLIRLFNEGRLLGAGAFKGDKLVSLAFFNLISYGKEKKTPYLCGVWTNPKYRGIRLATQVNKKLMQGVSERRDELQRSSLLTIEGNDAALHLYNKLGYKNVDGEMTFLGDVKAPQNTIEHTTVDKNANISEETFYQSGSERMKIDYSKEKFFPHPSNIDGKMTRIMGISLLQDDITTEEFVEYLQEFFRTHRFCKLNINELDAKEKKLGRIFGIEDNNAIELKDAFSKIKFEGLDGKTFSIKPSNNIMEKDMSRDLDLLESEELER